MKSFFKNLLRPEVRQWLYRISISVVMLLGGYGLIEESVIPLIIALVASVFAISVADSNVYPVVNSGDLVIKESSLDNLSNIEVKDLRKLVNDLNSKVEVSDD